MFIKLSLENGKNEIIKSHCPGMSYQPSSHLQRDTVYISP